METFVIEARAAFAEGVEEAKTNPFRKVPMEAHENGSEANETKPRERRAGQTEQLAMLANQHVGVMAKLKGLWWLVLVVVAIAGAGWVTSQFLNTKADASVVDVKFSSVNQQIGALSERVGEGKVESAGIKAELSATHEHVKDLNANLIEMNKNLLDVGRGYRPNRILTPLSEPKK